MRRLLLLPVLLLAACGQHPRVDPFPRMAALRDREPREVKVVRVWDQVSDRIEEGADPHVSHWIEVDVLAGPGAGSPMTLPYDQWNTGKAPPAEGDRLMMCPAEWVSRDNRTPGRPYGR